MAFIKLRNHSNTQDKWINSRAILEIEPLSDSSGHFSKVYFFGGAYESFIEDPSEIMAKIEKAMNPPEIVMHKAKPNNIVWGEPPEAMLNRKIGALEAERDSARRTASLARATAEKLEARNALLEAEIKAWKDAASINLSNDADDEVGKFETPDSLVSRLQGLYRWATQAEKHGTAASAEVAEIKAKLEAWRKAANTSPGEVDPDEVCEILTPGDLTEQIMELYQQAQKAEKHGTEASAEVAEMKVKLEAWGKAADPLDASWVDPFYSGVGARPESLKLAIEDAQRWLDEFAEYRRSTAKNLAAWKEAASVDLPNEISVGLPGINTPEALTERIRHLISLSMVEEPTLDIGRAIATVHAFYIDRPSKYSKAVAAVLEAWQGVNPMPKPYKYRLY